MTYLLKLYTVTLHTDSQDNKKAVLSQGEPRDTLWIAIRVKSAVKLFSKLVQLICDHGTWTLRTDGQTDDIRWHNRAQRSIAQ